MFWIYVKMNHTTMLSKVHFMVTYLLHLDS